MGRAMHLQARILYKQDRLTEAKSEALDAINAYEKAGTVGDLEICRGVLRRIEEKMEGAITSGGSDFNGKLPDTATTSYVY